MSASSSVLSRVRMFEQQGTKSEVPASFTPRSDAGEIKSSPSVKATEASPSQGTNSTSVAFRYQNALNAKNRTPDVPQSTGSKGTPVNNKPAGAEVVGWPSSDDEDKISPPKLTDKTPAAWSASGPLAKKQQSVAARYQQAISSPQIKSPQAVNGRTGGNFVDWPSPAEEEGIPPPPKTISAPGAPSPSPRGDSGPRTSQFLKVLSSSGGKSPNAQSGNELVGWPSEEDDVSSPVESAGLGRSPFNKLSSFKARSESGVKAPLAVKSPNALSRNEIAAWPPSKRTEPDKATLTPSPVSGSISSGLSPNAQSRKEIAAWPPSKRTEPDEATHTPSPVSGSISSGRSPGKVASPHEDDLTAESGSPAKDQALVDEVFNEAKSTSKFSRAAKLQARKMHQVILRDENSAPESDSRVDVGSTSLDPKHEVSVGAASRESKATRLSRSVRLQSKRLHHMPSTSQQSGGKDPRGLKQSLDDAAVVLKEERSSVGSVSSSQRSSLSTAELSSIAKRAMKVALSDALSEDRPPSTITTKTKKSARNLKSALELVKGKGRADISGPSDDASTIVTTTTSETNESGKKAGPANKLPSSKPPPPRSEKPAAAMRARSHPSLNPSGSGEVSTASRELPASCCRSLVNLPSWFVEQQGSEEADNGTVGSETTPKTTMSSRRQAFTQAQRRLAKRKGGSTDDSSVASVGSSAAAAKKKTPSSIQPVTRDLPKENPKDIKNSSSRSVIGPTKKDATHDSAVASQTSEVSFAARKNIMKKFGVSLSKSESEDASRLKDPLGIAPRRVSDHPAYRQRQSPSRTSTPVQGEPASLSTTPVQNEPEEDDSVSPPGIASSTNTGSVSESSESAWKVPTLSSSTSFGTSPDLPETDLPEAQSKDSTTSTSETGKSTAEFAPFDGTFGSNPFRESDFDFSAEENTEFDGSFADPPSTLIGQFHVGSSSDEGSQSEKIAMKGQQVGKGAGECQPSYLPASQRAVAKKEEHKPIQGPVLHNDKKGAVRWWQKAGAKGVDGIGVSASSSSSIGLSDKSADDLFDGLDEDTVASFTEKLSNGVDGIFTHSSDESSGTNEELELESVVAPVAVNPSSSDSAEHYGGTLDRARLQNVNSDITSSILGGEQVREVAEPARLSISMAAPDSTSTEEEKNEVVETQESILVVDDSLLSERSREETDEDASQYSEGDMVSTDSASRGRKGGYGRLEDEEEAASESSSKRSRPSIFMKLGLGMLDSFTAGICKPPGVKTDDLVLLSPVSNQDGDQDKHRKEDNKAAEKEDVNEPPATAEKAVAAVLARTYSEGTSAASVTRATMNAQEQKVWSEWDEKESKAPTRSSQHSPSGSHFQQAEQNLRGPSKPTQPPPERTMKQKQDTQRVPSTPLSHNQRRILEKFSSTLKNHGLEVLKLNRHTKWEVRYLTVSKEVRWLNAGESNRQSGDRGQCPLGMLWLKRFNAGKSHSVEMIQDQGRGGLLFSHLTKVSAASRTEVNYPTSKKLQEKFKDSVPVLVECNDRSLTFLCKTTDEAHFLCTGLRVIMDVLKRESEFMFEETEQGDLYEM